MNRKLFLCFALLAAVACTDDKPEEPAGGTVPADMPEYTFSTVEFRRLVNGSFRGWTTCETIAGGQTADATQTRVLEGMNHYSPVDFHVETAWGGRLDCETPAILAGAEGYFRIGKSEGRLYFVDPDGGAVILRGTQHVAPGTSDQHKAAFNSRFGSLAKWSAETGGLLASCGINYVSWGANRVERFPDEVRDNLLSPGRRKMAYGETLYLLRTFMWDMKPKLGYDRAFEDDTYNRLVLAFEPKFQEYVEELAREKCALFADDRHFVGYYLDNELPFVAYENSNPRLGVELQQFLELPAPYDGARRFAEAFMQQEGIASKEAITPAHREKFRAAVADHYYKVTTEAVRKADPHHLILGSRLHDWSKYTQGIVAACARYCDAVSLNYYARWQPEPGFMADLAAWCGDKPFIVTEFYVKGADASAKGCTYDNLNGGGWLVRTQKNRGEFYQNFCLRLLETRNCAGWMHFEYCDSCEGGLCSNKGLVSVDYAPYEDFLSAMKRFHANLYPLAGYYDRKSE